MALNSKEIKFQGLVLDENDQIIETSEGILCEVTIGPGKNINLSEYFVFLCLLSFIINPFLCVIISCSGYN